MKVQVQNWMRESIDDSLLTDAVNDGIESLAESIIITKIEQMMAGPVNVSFAQATERAQIVSITDPLVAPTVTQAAGGALAPRTVKFYYTLVTESGTETNLSPTTSINVLANQLATVQPPAWASGAIGWNVYANLNDGRTALQNDGPIDFSTPWTEPNDTGVIDDPDQPPAPTSNTTGDNIFLIEHMEMQMPDGTYKSWNMGDLDSELMRRAARTLASASPYQSYYYDLIGNQTLELRPAAGTALTPRHFYVSKPRRVRFDNAPMPFSGIAYVAFIRFFALSLLKLSQEEYQASGQWEAKADKERMDIMKSLTAFNRNKNNVITPYIY